MPIDFQSLRKDLKIPLKQPAYLSAQKQSEAEKIYICTLPFQRKEWQLFLKNFNTPK